MAPGAASESGEAGQVAGMAALLRALVQAARETAEELSREELDPDRLIALMNRREAMFASLKQVHSEAQSRTQPGDSAALDDELRELARELLELDRANLEVMRERLTDVREHVSEIQLQRRSLTAYGWVDPVHAPRGAFIDKMQG